MNILKGWNKYHFKGDIIRHVSESNQFQNNIRIIGSQDIKQNNMRYQISRQKLVQYLEFSILISHFDLLRYQLHDIVQKCLYTPYGVMDPTFQMKYVLAI